MQENTFPFANKQDRGCGMERKNYQSSRDGKQWQIYSPMGSKNFHLETRNSGVEEV